MCTIALFNYLRDLIMFKDYLLAIFIGLTLAYVLVVQLSK